MSQEGERKFGQNSQFPSNDSSNYLSDEELQDWLNWYEEGKGETHAVEPLPLNRDITIDQENSVERYNPFRISQAEREALTILGSEERRHALLEIQNRRREVYPGYTLIDDVIPRGYTTSDLVLADGRIIENIYDRDQGSLHALAWLQLYSETGRFTTLMWQQLLNETYKESFSNKYMENLRRRAARDLRDKNFTLFAEQVQGFDQFYLRDLQIAPVIPSKAA